MFCVCVRTVFSDTASSRAMSGPPRSLLSSRRTSSSRSLSGSIRACLTGPSDPVGPARRASVRRYSGAIRCFAGDLQQGRHRLAFVEEDADVALRLGQRPRPERAMRAHLRGRRRRGAPAPEDDRTSICSQCGRHPRLLPGGVQQLDRVGMRCVRTVLDPRREERSGERDVLELVQVAELVRGRETPLARPARGIR